MTYVFFFFSLWRVIKKCSIKRVEKKREERDEGKGDMRGNTKISGVEGERRGCQSVHLEAIIQWQQTESEENTCGFRSITSLY